MDYGVNVFEYGLTGGAGKQMVFQAVHLAFWKAAKGILLPFILWWMRDKAYYDLVFLAQSRTPSRESAPGTPSHNGTVP
jgi:hypothetical protein